MQRVQIAQQPERRQRGGDAAPHVEDARAAHDPVLDAGRTDHGSPCRPDGVVVGEDQDGGLVAAPDAGLEVRAGRSGDAPDGRAEALEALGQQRGAAVEQLDLPAGGVERREVAEGRDGLVAPVGGGAADRGGELGDAHAESTTVRCAVAASIA